MDRANFIPMLIAIPSIVGTIFVAMIVYQFRDTLLDSVKGFRRRKPQAERPRRSVALSPEIQQLMDELLNPPIMTSGPMQEQPDGHGRTGVRPLYTAVDILQSDITRSNVIDVLVLAGGDVQTIRKLLKGENDTIGKEIKAARERLGLDTPAADPLRVIPSREHVNGHLVESEIVM